MLGVARLQNPLETDVRKFIFHSPLHHGKSVQLVSLSAVQLHEEVIVHLVDPQLLVIVEIQGK